MNKVRKPKKDVSWPERIAVVARLGGDEERGPMFGACFSGDEIHRVAYGDIAYNGDSDLCRLLETPSFPIRDTLIIMESAYETLTQAGFWDYVRRGIFTLKGVDERRPMSPRVIVENPPTIIQWGIRGRAGSSLIVDPLNYGYAIADMSDSDIDDFRDEIPTNESHLMRLFVRVMQMILFVEEYQAMLSELRLGECWKSTAGSQAYYGYRLNYMNEDIEASTPGEAEELIASASYGGRCECYYLGDAYGPVFQLDFNQLYSAIAFGAAFPVRLKGVVDVTNPADLKGCMNEHLLGDVTLDTDAAIYPYRTGAESHERNSITIYPTGEFRTQLAGPELSIAIRAGHVKKIHRLYCYEMSTPLDKWAAAFWEYRQQCEPFFASVVKRMALALYGKFGQRQRDWNLDPDDIPVADMVVGDWYTLGHEGKPIRHRVLDGKCSVEVVGGYVPQSSPPIAAWMTSYGRATLFDAMMTARNVYYCDTDSIWTDAAGLNRLSDKGYVGPALGQMRIVGQYGKVTFHGIKHYTVEDIETHAGIPDHAVPVPGNAHRWSAQASFDSFMASREYPYAKMVVRNYRGKGLYRHGVPQADGSVVPHHIARCGVT